MRIFSVFKILKVARRLVCLQLRCDGVVQVFRNIFVDQWCCRFGWRNFVIVKFCFAALFSGCAVILYCFYCCYNSFDMLFNSLSLKCFIHGCFPKRDLLNKHKSTISKSFSWLEIDCDVVVIVCIRCLFLGIEYILEFILCPFKRFCVHCRSFVVL